jgi:hypothetical protein
LLDGAARWDPENPEVAGNQRTAPSCTTYQLVILANAGIQTIGESDDWDEDSRQARGFERMRGAFLLVTYLWRSKDKSPVRRAEPAM